MSRVVTLFTGQWADVPRHELLPMIRDMGYDGVELACWGDHFDVVEAASSDVYIASLRDQLETNGLVCRAISTHLVGQAVCDRIDERHRSILPDRVWGDGDEDGVRSRAAEEVKAAAAAARALGVDVVNGFTGSSVWHLLYAFPPTDFSLVERGFKAFADAWNPILDAFDAQRVRFALEVHPTEIAYDIHTARMALDALQSRDAFGFNFDPSHLVWQGIDPVRFIDAFATRIYHVHMKDAAVTLDGTSSILSSHFAFGDHRRGWDFRSVGRGDVAFEPIIRALNRIGYTGPLSVEWEDSGMDRVRGATESCEFVRGIDFEPSSIAFDAAFED